MCFESSFDLVHFVGIRVIDTRHEVNAVFAADGMARVSSKPGTILVNAVKN